MAKHNQLVGVLKCGCSLWAHREVTRRWFVSLDRNADCRDTHRLLRQMAKTWRDRKNWKQQRLEASRAVANPDEG